jgi:transposase
VRSYIPEKRQKGKRRWQGKAEEQQAVYENRRRVRGDYGKRLLKRRGELVERSFAHCYETGGMRRCHLRGRENILKRQLAHVSAFNLSLVMRQLLGAGTPRELKSRSVQLVLRLFLLLNCRSWPNGTVEPSAPLALGSTEIYRSIKPRCRTFWNSATCTTDC